MVPGVVVRIASAPVFLATKWDAFHDRGGADWHGSHDLEDIVTVVAGRPELPGELRQSEGDVREYVANQSRLLLQSDRLEDVVAGALPDARLIPDLVARVITRLEEIGRLGETDG